MKRTVAVLAFLFGVVSLAVFGYTASYALDPCAGNSSSAICPTLKDPETKVSGFFDDLVSTMLFALGMVCVIVIIIGGIRYATADGDQGRIKSAKDTILYAVIGLIVAIFAFAIVNFVIGRIG